MGVGSMFNNSFASNRARCGWIYVRGATHRPKGMEHCSSLKDGRRKMAY